MDISNVKKISWNNYKNEYAKDARIMVSKGVETSNGAYGFSTNSKIFESTDTSGSYDCSGLQGIYGFAILCKSTSSSQNGSVSVKWNVEYN